MHRLDRDKNWDILEIRNRRKLRTVKEYTTKLAIMLRYVRLLNARDKVLLYLTPCPDRTTKTPKGRYETKRITTVSSTVATPSQLSGSLSLVAALFATIKTRIDITVRVI
jgi:hypothetical protein